MTAQWAWLRDCCRPIRKCDQNCPKVTASVKHAYRIFLVLSLHLRQTEELSIVPLIGSD